MGLIDRLKGFAPKLGIAGEAAGNLAEALLPNASRKKEIEADDIGRARSQFMAEFPQHVCGPFDSFVNGLNRLPRPLLTFSTFGLMAYSMLDPASFSVRMSGLAQVPEPLWWLMGVIVSFYFGAREAHYARGRSLANSFSAARPLLPSAPITGKRIETGDTQTAAVRFADNAALRDWASATG